jgi:hypothetical protein
MQNRCALQAHDSPYNREKVFVFDSVTSDYLCKSTEHALDNVPHTVLLHQRDHILFPIHNVDHWLLVLVCYPGKSQQKILIIDSLSMSIKTSYYMIALYLQLYLLKRFEKEKQEYSNGALKLAYEILQVKQQDRKNDCGVYLQYNVELLLKNIHEVKYVEEEEEDHVDQIITRMITQLFIHSISSRRAHLMGLVLAEHSIKNTNLLSISLLPFSNTYPIQDTIVTSSNHKQARPNSKITAMSMPVQNRELLKRKFSHILDNNSPAGKRHKTIPPVLPIETSTITIQEVNASTPLMSQTRPIIHSIVPSVQAVIINNSCSSSSASVTTRGVSEQEAKRINNLTHNSNEQECKEIFRQLLTESLTTVENTNKKNGFTCVVGFFYGMEALEVELNVQTYKDIDPNNTTFYDQVVDVNKDVKTQRCTLLYKRYLVERMNSQIMTEYQTLKHMTEEYAKAKEKNGLQKYSVRKDIQKSVALGRFAYECKQRLLLLLDNENNRRILANMNVKFGRISVMREVANVLYFADQDKGEIAKSRPVLAQLFALYFKYMKNTLVQKLMAIITSKVFIV